MSFRTLLALFPLLFFVAAAPISDINSTSARDLSSFAEKQLVDDDSCQAASTDYSGTSHWNCKAKRHVTNGICPVPEDAIGLGCKAYCEIRRRLFLGKELAIGNRIDAVTLNTTLTMPEGLKYSVDKALDFKLGSLAASNAVFEEAIKFTYSVHELSSQTSHNGVKISVQTSNDLASQWVAFPIFVETCGDLTSVDSTMIPAKNPREKSRQVCGGNAKTRINACATVPYRGDGTLPLLLFALRSEEGKGIAPMSKQHISYKAICNDLKQGNCLAPK